MLITACASCGKRFKVDPKRLRPGTICPACGGPFLKSPKSGTAPTRPAVQTSRLKQAALRGRIAAARRPSGLSKFISQIPVAYRLVALGVLGFGLLSALGAFGYSQWRSTAREREFRAEEARAGAVFFDALSRIWGLEAKCVQESEEVWKALRAGLEASKVDAKIVALFQGVPEGSPPAEETLRQYLSERRSRDLKASAEDLLARLDGASRKLLETAAGDLRASPADVLLDCLNWHGYERLRVLEDIWNRSRSYPMIPQNVLSSYFSGKALPPSPERGAREIERTETELRYELFGAFVSATLERAPQDKARLPLKEVRFRSTYLFLRTPNAYVPEVSAARVESSPGGTGYLVGAEEWIRGYLESGVRFEWRRRALGPVSAPKREAEPPPKARPQAKPKPKAGPTLAKPELIERVAPAVPQISLLEGGWGSGFLVLDGGRPAVITNFHVVARAKSPITVGFIRSEEGKPAGIYVSTVVKPEDCFAHPEADVALLPLGNWKTPEELEELGIRPLELAEEGTLVRQGEEVFTVGHPVGLGNKPLFLSTKFGDISGPTRTFPPGNQRFLQMTVSIYPGNSGGPVCNLAGQVIGISTLKQLVSGGALSDDLNFAVDIAYARELLAGKRVPLLERAARESQEKPVEVKLREALQEILSGGYATAEEKISFEIDLAPNGEAERALELSPAKEYALWIVAFADGTTQSRDVEIEVTGKSTQPVVSLARPSIGTLVQLSRLSQDSYTLRLKNPSETKLKVRVQGFSKPRS